MIAPGTLLQNRYIVLNQVGQGGMGTVYIATDRRFGSTVALKETHFEEPALRKAFEREARLLNSLRHPALPRVSDHFTEDTGQFLVMEFIPGDDLSEMLRQRGEAFPANDVLNWADQLLDALDYLHTQEPPVIHRDIKPQNLKLMARGQIILLDFGLAKNTPAAHPSRATATGSVFGYSRNYAPLEQIQGAGTDPRSDFYSLAATLYHLLTGITPPDALTRATEVLNGQPDPLRPASEVRPDVAEPVAEALARALALNAGHRPQNAAAMREMLREARQQTRVVAGDASAGKQATPPTSHAAATILDRQTQLMNNAAASSTPLDPQAATRANDADAAATTTDPNDPIVSTATPPDARTVAATRTTPPSRNSASPPVAPLAADRAHRRDSSASVVTRVATAKRDEPQSRPAPRTLSIAASILVLAVVAAGVYKFTQPPASPTTTTNDPAATQTNTDTLVPQTASETPSTQLNAPAPTTQNPATTTDAPTTTTSAPTTTSAEPQSAPAAVPPATAQKPDPTPDSNAARRPSATDNGATQRGRLTIERPAPEQNERAVDNDPDPLPDERPLPPRRRPPPPDDPAAMDDMREEDEMRRREMERRREMRRRRREMPYPPP